MSNKMRELEAKLTAQQRKAAYLLVENELLETGQRRTQEEIAKEVGIDRSNLYLWRTRNKAFIAYKNEIADDFLADKRDRVYGQLMKLINAPQPSVKAIDLFMRRHGLLTDRQVTETVGGEGSRGNEDIAKEIDELDELLGEEK